MTLLDLVAIGRVSVDLYGQQVGGRLEDVATFLKGVGGCPANVAIGAARLGLKSALITRVGDEPMGRFVREQLAREGVDTRAVHVDAERLTALVLLGVRDEETFPLIFYRENCADAALDEGDVDDAFIAGARALLITGTHFSLAGGARAQRKAIAAARAFGRRVILDVDYRPNLWGIGGHGAGESRYARSARVTQVLAEVLPACDLIVGTEEELHVASGCEDTLAAIRRVRALSDAVIVCKRGPQGCVVFAGAIPERVEDGLVSPGLPVEVYNVLGAGDAFLAGYLSGYLRDAPHAESARLGNACGALAVSRLLCSAEFPTLPELRHYLDAGSSHRALREDPRLNELHRATTRRPGPRRLTVLALDRPGELEDLARAAGAAPARLQTFRRLALEAAGRAAAGRPDVGVLLDAAGDPALLRQAEQRGLWVAQAVERADSRPLEFVSGDALYARLNEWPVTRAVKCRCQYDPGDLPALRAAQEASLLRLAAACRAQSRELVLELSAPPGAHAHDATAGVLARVYALGIRPDWWLLAAQADAAAWQGCARQISAHDPYCRGVLLRLSEDTVPHGDALTRASAVDVVHGLVAGRTILASAAHGWLSGTMNEEAAIADIAARLNTVIELSTSGPRSAS
ncbi:MAG TPA: 5-dehydro-2-deoxygluconokinase [Steroidobacteraceae bacterium]|nr:5-dehydro-2-deoxygluconokinase [Steroidobacteraceae bacterium]